MRWSKADRLSLALLLLGAALIAWLRPGLAAQESRLHSGRDPYLLPPPEQTLLMSLGYRAALADLIFGHVLVGVGIHLSEKRLFEFAGHYLETINTLDPKFRDPYRYADAIMTLQAVKVSEDTYRHARDIILRGARELPYDQDLHLSGGQYLAYLAPAWLTNPAEAEEFRQQGARLLARACELAGANENVPYHCVTAAVLYSDAGNHAASQAFLERLLMVVDDPAIRQLAQGKLNQLRGNAELSEAQKRYQQLLELWRTDLTFISRAAFSALGPRFDSAACAGPARAGKHACETSFRDLLPRDPGTPVQ